MRTGTEIEQHVYDLIRNSPIKNLITGEVYLAGLRPLNSDLEDTIVIYQTSLGGQIQDGSVNVNTYVPNIPFESNGSMTMVKDFNRCILIERACQDFANALPVGRYKFSLATGIQTFEYEADQHFVNMRLKFSYNTF